MRMPKGYNQLKTGRWSATLEKENLISQTLYFNKILSRELESVLNYLNKLTPRPVGLILEVKDKLKQFENWV